MIDGQWSLGDLVWGTSSDQVFNVKAPDLGDVKIRSQDSDRDGGDGVVFGVDYFGGRTITFDLGFRGSSEAEVRALVRRFAAAWRGDDVRSEAGASTLLRCRYVGVESQVSGRPRRFAADMSKAFLGYASAQATFETGDSAFYSSTSQVVRLGYVSVTTGGIVAPLMAPIATTTNTDRSYALTVTGGPVWPVVTFYGPCVNPSLELFGLWKFGLTMTLGVGESVAVDTGPAERTVLRSDGASVAGKISRRSARLAKMSIPAGQYEANVGGSSASGNGYVELSWRQANETL